MSERFDEAVRAMIARRREAPGDDLLSMLVMADVDGEKLSDRDVI